MLPEDATGKKYPTALMENAYGRKACNRWLDKRIIQLHNKPSMDNKSPFQVDPDHIHRSSNTASTAMMLETMQQSYYFKRQISKNEACVSPYTSITITWYKFVIWYDNIQKHITKRGKKARLM